VDLELIIRAIWRKRFQMFIWIVAFGVAVPIGGALLLPPKYSSSTSVAVYPATAVDGTVSATYGLQPDRFVATQIATLSSRESAQGVADALKIPTTKVLEMVEVTQIEKSDALLVTATSTDAELSAKVASLLSKNYVDAVQKSTSEQYAGAIKSIDEQLAGIQTQIDTVTANIRLTGGSVSDPGPSQSQLNNLVSQQTELTSQRQKLVVDSQNIAAGTRVLSTAAVSTLPVGLSKKMLAIYGAALGLGIGAILVALRTSSGRSLADLESRDSFDGVAVLGVIPPRRRLLARSSLFGRREAVNMRTLRIASELRTLIESKGSVVVVPIGRSDRIQRATRLLGSRVARGQADPVKAASRPGPKVAAKATVTGYGMFDQVARGLYQTDSMDSFLQPGEPHDLHVVLAVDVDRVSPAELADTFVTLGSLGTEVLGIVGVG